jgi:hypothetical protein
MDWFDFIKVSNIPPTSSPQLLQKAKALFLTAKKTGSHKIQI